MAHFSIKRNANNFKIIVIMEKIPNRYAIWDFSKAVH